MKFFVVGSNVFGQFYPVIHVHVGRVNSIVLIDAVYNSALIVLYVPGMIKIGLRIDSVDTYGKAMA